MGKTQKIGTSNLNQQASDWTLQAIQDNPDLTSNHSFMLVAAANNSSLISRLAPSLKNDSGFLAKLYAAIPGIETTHQDIAKAQEERTSISSKLDQYPALKKDRQFMLNAIKIDPYFIRHPDSHLQKDLSFLKKAQEAIPHLKEDQLFMIMRLGSFGA
jgi:hypothetical protein